MNLSKKICILLAALTPTYTFSYVTCPVNANIQCVQPNPNQCDAKMKSICIVTSHLQYPWILAAPSVGSGIRIDTSNGSCSLLPPGNYTLDYALSYYGAVTGVKVPAAYCMYSVQNVLAIAGLYNTQYVKIGDNWKKYDQGYICKDAQKCLYSF